MKAHISNTDPAGLCLCRRHGLRLSLGQCDDRSSFSAYPGLAAEPLRAGDSFALSAHAGGTFVLFLSTANNVVTNEPQRGVRDLFLACRTNATVSW